MLIVSSSNILSQFWSSHHWAVSFSHWPVLLFRSLSVCRRCKRTHVSIKKNNGNIGPAVVYYLPLALIFVMFVIGAWMGDSVCMIQAVLSSLTITTKNKIIFLMCRYKSLNKIEFKIMWLDYIKHRNMSIERFFKIPVLTETC